jgi:nitroreductase
MDYESALNCWKIPAVYADLNRPTAGGYIDKIIDAGRLAPSGFNQQPWDFHCDP